MESFNETQKRILALKKEKGALILAHYYVPLEVQDVADAVCDSFAMAKKARDAKERLIVICGVRFMGESAKVLSPDKKVLLPAPDAGCPMADMVTPEDVLRLRAAHPDAAVMCYVNTSAAVKAVSDVCCTSSSALRIAAALPQKEIIFVPDKNLGSFVAEKLPEKKVWLHTGYCPTHQRVTGGDVRAAKAAHPGALVLAHPECRDEVLAQADYIGSTAGILEYAEKSPAKEFIIGTESEIVARLRRALPDRKVYSAASSFVCPNMKKVTLADLLASLENEQYEVTLPADVLAAAKRSLDRMVSF